MKKLFYYFNHWTWGLLQNIIGGCACIILNLCGFKSHKYRNAIITEVGEGWGGLSLGMFLFVCKDTTDHNNAHEYGHSIQSLKWGPLHLFVVELPSAVRYWYREGVYHFKGKEAYNSLPDYDAIWFEREASDLGERAAKNEWKWL